MVKKIVCPNCESFSTRTDASGTWGLLAGLMALVAITSQDAVVLVGGLVVLLFGVFFALRTANYYCDRCGARFKVLR